MSKPALVLRVVARSVREDQHVFALRLAAQRACAVDQNAGHLGRFDQALLADCERGLRSMRQNSMLWPPSVCPRDSAFVASRCGAPGVRPRICSVRSRKLPADEQPHDSDASRPARFESLDALLQADRIGHAERDFDVVLVLQRRDGREHFLVPLLRAAMRHHQHAEVFALIIALGRRHHAQPASTASAATVESLESLSFMS